MQRHTPSYPLGGVPPALPVMDRIKSVIRDPFVSTEEQTRAYDNFTRDNSIRASFRPTPDSHGASILLVMLQELGARRDIDTIYSTFNRTLVLALDANLSMETIASLFYFLLGFLQPGSPTFLLKVLQQTRTYHNTARTSRALYLVAMAALLPIGTDVSGSLDLFMRLCHLPEVQTGLSAIRGMQALDSVAYAVQTQVGNEDIGPASFFCHEKAYVKWVWLLSSDSVLTKKNAEKLSSNEWNDLYDSHSEFGSALMVAHDLKNKEMLARIVSLVHPTYLQFTLNRLLMRYVNLRKHDSMPFLLWVAQNTQLPWVTSSTVGSLTSLRLEYTLVTELRTALFVGAPNRKAVSMALARWLFVTRPAFMKNFLEPMMDVVVQRKNWEKDPATQTPVFPAVLNKGWTADAVLAGSGFTEEEMASSVLPIVQGLREKARLDGTPFYDEYVRQRMHEAEVAFDAIDSGQLATVHTDFVTAMSDVDMPRELMATVGEYLFDLPGEEPEVGLSAMGKQLIASSSSMDAARRRAEQEARGAERVAAGLARRKRQTEARAEDTKRSKLGKRMMFL